MNQIFVYVFISAIHLLIFLFQVYYKMNQSKFNPKTSKYFKYMILGISIVSLLFLGALDNDKKHLYFVVLFIIVIVTCFVSNHILFPIVGILVSIAYLILFSFGKGEPDAQIEPEPGIVRTSLIEPSQSNQPSQPSQPSQLNQPSQQPEPGQLGQHAIRKLEKTQQDSVLIDGFSRLHTVPKDVSSLIHQYYYSYFPDANNSLNVIVERNAISDNYREQKSAEWLETMERSLEKYSFCDHQKTLRFSESDTATQWSPLKIEMECKTPCNYKFRGNCPEGVATFHADADELEFYIHNVPISRRGFLRHIKNISNLQIYISDIKSRQETYLRVIPLIHACEHPPNEKNIEAYLNNSPSRRGRARDIKWIVKCNLCPTDRESNPP